MSSSCYVVERSHADKPGYWRLAFDGRENCQGVQAGQFVHILPRPSDGSDPLLRRAFSILSVKGNIVEVLFRVQGKGTTSLSRLRSGDTVDVLWPLGLPFPVAQGPLILVGGGVGVPPMLALASQEAGKARREELTVIIGGRSENDILCQEDFHALGINPLICTEDGSLGERGLVTQTLQRLFSTEAPPEQKTPGTMMFHVKPTVYACGPLGMLKAIAAICQEAEVSCLVSLEENMPCGIGVCNGCVVPTHNAQGSDFDRYRRICVEGPGVWAREIDWSAF
ncbi:MAG TPA: dihydroorotate dehydrogenase electron transfer subunit [Abditibacteriaceae bacterium]|jgi:dihydroorotate dehydrogenase electron transfer subunit